MDQKTRIVPFAAALALAACGGSGSGAPEETSDATVQAIFDVPATDVACIRLVASGPKKTTTKDFAVSPGQSTVDAFMVNGIPTGRVVFSGSAYGQSCNFIGLSLTPTWIADDLTVTATAAQPANVSLTFHGNGSAVVSGDFAGDEYTASTLAGAAGQQASVDGVGRAPRLEGRNGIVLSGNFLYFIDRNFDPNTTFVGMTVRRLDVSTLQVVTLAGNPNSQGTTDGPGASA